MSSKYYTSNGRLIWNYLTTHGFTKAGAAGMLACIWGESTFDPICCQSKGSSYRQTYTRNVDNGVISRYTFSHSGGGYGLCQWTSSGRKAGLYDFAKNRHVSIGNLEMQCAYIIRECKQAYYKKVYDTCTTTTNPAYAAEVVLLYYERPASVGPNAKPSTKRDKINQLRDRGKAMYTAYYSTKVRKSEDTQGTGKKKTSQTEDKAKKTTTPDKPANKKSTVDSSDVSGEIKLGGIRRRVAIYADGKLIWETGLSDPEYAIHEPKLNIALNTGGSLEFKLAQTHWLYSSLKRLSTTITIKTTDDDIGYRLVWRGRVLDTTTDFYNLKRVYCEGELSFLNDSVIRPYSYEIKPSLMFDYLIKKHNSVASENRRFSTWRTDIKLDDKDTWLYLFENSEYESTYDNLNNQLIDGIGGYVKALNGKITYSRKPGGVGKQVISFGVSLLDLEEYINAADVYTVIIPLGGLVPTTVEEEGEKNKVDKRRTIKKENNGKDYLENQTGIGLWGRIERARVWDDITDAKSLITLGKRELKEAIKQAITITIKAVDLHLLDVDTEELYVGYSYRIISEPHGIDTYFVLTAVDYNLENPAESTYTFGTAFHGLTNTVIKNNKKAKKNSGNIDLIKSGLMS